MLPEEIHYQFGGINDFDYSQEAAFYMALSLLPDGIVRYAAENLRFISDNRYSLAQYRILRQHRQLRDS